MKKIIFTSLLFIYAIASISAQNQNKFTLTDIEVSTSFFGTSELNNNYTFQDALNHGFNNYSDIETIIHEDFAKTFYDPSKTCLQCSSIGLYRISTKLKWDINKRNSNEFIGISINLSQAHWRYLSWRDESLVHPDSLYFSNGSAYLAPGAGYGITLIYGLKKNILKHADVAIYGGIGFESYLSRQWLNIGFFNGFERFDASNALQLSSSLGTDFIFRTHKVWNPMLSLNFFYGLEKFEDEGFYRDQWFRSSNVSVGLNYSISAKKEKKGN